MALSTITARIEAADKMNVDNFCASVGLNASIAINLFVKAVLRERRIPFEIAQPSAPFYNRENQAYILKSVQELRAEKGQVHELSKDNKT